MATALITFVVLGCLLLWLRAWEHRSRLAIGIVVGAVLAVVAGPLARSLLAMPHIPVWLPALPFALIAISLFGFGLLALFWSED